MPDISPTLPQQAAHRPRRSLRALSWLLILLGLLALADAATTLVWQEPISALYARLQQERLHTALRQVERAQPTPIERHRLALLPAQRQRIAFLARELQHRAAKGSPVGSIHIPRIGIDFVLVAGTGTPELEKGPGVFPETHFPGIAGTTAVAGHRTTYLAPFRHIDALHKGNRILLNMPYAHFTYTVIGRRVVQPSNVGAAVNPVGYSRLVLSACTPLFSAAKRLLVFARLTRTVPIGAARLTRTSPAGGTGPARTAPPGSAPLTPLPARADRALTSGARTPPAVAPRPSPAAPLPAGAPLRTPPRGRPT